METKINTNNRNHGLSGRVRFIYTENMGKIVLILIVVLVIAGGTYFLISTGKLSNPLNNKTATTSLGEQIYDQTKNPLEGKIPETNPFAKINPFKGVYKNPFE